MRKSHFRRVFSLFFSFFLFCLCVRLCLTVFLPILIFLHVLSLHIFLFLHVLSFHHLLLPTSETAGKTLALHYDFWCRINWCQLCFNCADPHLEIRGGGGGFQISVPHSEFPGKNCLNRLGFNCAANILDRNLCIFF